MDTRYTAPIAEKQLCCAVCEIGNLVVIGQKMGARIAMIGMARERSRNEADI